MKIKHIRKVNRAEREEEKARREAKRYGYEYRPGAAKSANEARRLEAGFGMIESEEGNGDRN